MNFLTSFLNKITMYRVILYVLISYLVVAALEGFLGILPLPPLQIVFQALYLFVVANAANKIFSKIFGAVINSESATITALILALIVGPFSLAGIVFLTLVTTLAIASKYVLAIKKRHILNPAAVAVVLTAAFGWPGASWWVGNLPMAAFILVGGFLILAKIKRFTLAGVFLAIFLLRSVFFGINPLSLLLVSPMLFFASVMLIEPLTSPVETKKQIVYAAFIAIVLIGLQQFTNISYTIELALLAGNVLFFIMSLPFRTTLTLASKEKIAVGTYAFTFSKDSPFTFAPGQFMHWTLPHEKHDSRGVRRYFTIASSPTQDEITIAVRVPKVNASSFKKTLVDLKQGDQIIAMDAAGEFTLPKDKTIPLVFIAGGIGITPFASMAKWLLDNGQKRDIILLYSNPTEGDIAFKKLFTAAKKVGIETDYIITSKDGHITEETIKKKIPNWKKRTYFISGPQPMVEILKAMLIKMGVLKVKTDFFPGYTEKS